MTDAQKPGRDPVAVTGADSAAEADLGDEPTTAAASYGARTPPIEESSLPGRSA
jgi:hypothetical protein